jgi:hypothetical protein
VIADPAPLGLGAFVPTTFIEVESALVDHPRVAEQRTLGDTTTLADPAVVEEIQRRAASEVVGDED